MISHGDEYSEETARAWDAWAKIVRDRGRDWMCVVTMPDSFWKLQAWGGFNPWAETAQARMTRELQRQAFYANAARPARPPYPFSFTYRETHSSPGLFGSLIGGVL